ncbi:chorion class B protein Ld32-like [Melitaea cinxia]|uniref:chorion class B protein Ld32-like n=1 Tax=Melitaea cinxia TaxID=113334 RepID=UPI001E272B95|nr:chorion class B protein Ld32-like [Melitaea cinxia]
MSTLAFLLLAVQACLVQNVYSQCLRGMGAAMAGSLGWEGLAGPTMLGYGGPIATYPEYAAYGGSGVGNVGVAGEMGVAGTTQVAGQVPILGAVEFGGIVPAAGAVSIAGNCACNELDAAGPFAPAIAPFAATAPFTAARSFAPAFGAPFTYEAAPFAYEAAPFAYEAAPFAYEAAPFAYEAAPFAFEAAAVSASNGGGLGVSSASTIPPAGVSVLSENAIEGPLAVAGALPFLGTVALEGALPTAGAGAVNYGCGNGAVAILAENLAPAGIAGPLGYGIGAWGAEGFGYGPYGYGVGSLAGPFRAGCGCGRAI